MPDRNISNKIKFKKYTDLAKLKNDDAVVLIRALQSILKDAWGEFPQNFIGDHILKNAHTLIMAMLGDEYIGFCALSHKNILNKNIRYIEFLVIKNKYQNSRLGSKLLYLILRKPLIKSFFNIPPSSLEIMFITPNIRVLAGMSKFCSFIYPNPYSVDANGKIQSADDITFEMARELIRVSDNPKRIINREGLVLEGSYRNTPWLIYKDKNIPWHSNDKINKFAMRYLGYGSGADKEFIVRTKIAISSLIKYLFKKFD